MKNSYQCGRAIIIKEIIEMYEDLEGDISDVKEEIINELELLNDYDLIKEKGNVYELLKNK